MMKRLIVIVTTILLSLSDTQCVGQVCREVVIKSNDDLRVHLGTVIAKEHYLDPAKGITIVFSFKIDSLGEIHSAHVRYSRNLDLSRYYDICRSLEECVKTPFLFDSFKSASSGKYIVVDVPYFSK